ncbi:hypothetical protein niasHT_014704 [Heterodera trifolii]|uniref:Helix-turn-helix domain-containing protein n=1 Tax=Heterodera trifolii TaxID=157864 RepID=A0ABD2KWL1_9BILA
MFNAAEYGTQSLSNGYHNGAYCSTTFTFELDPIINQQIGKVAKPDKLIQKVANHHTFSDANQESPTKSENAIQDDADKDILNRMDAMNLSHTRLLTDGVLSANSHEYVLHPDDLSDHKNVHKQKTKRFKVRYDGANTAVNDSKASPSTRKTRQEYIELKEQFKKNYEKLKNEGMADSEIAAQYKIDRDSVYEWKKIFFPEMIKQKKRSASVSGI